MPTARPLTVRNCVYCGAAFETQYLATYCPKHRCNFQGKPSRLVDDEGPAARALRTEPYESRCCMCTRVQADYQLTSEQARRAVLLGLGRCPRPFCGGLLTLEPSNAGQRSAEARAVVHSGRITPIPRRSVSA